jgi:hypothetical protein
MIRASISTRFSAVGLTSKVYLSLCQPGNRVADPRWQSWYRAHKSYRGGRRQQAFVIDSERSGKFRQSHRKQTVIATDRPLSYAG